MALQMWSGRHIQHLTNLTRLIETEAIDTTKCDDCTRKGNPYICRQCSRHYKDLYDGDAWRMSHQNKPDNTDPVKARVIVPKTGREYYVSRAVYLHKYQMQAIRSDANSNYTEMGKKTGIYYYRPGWYEPLMGSSGAYLPIPDQVVEWANHSKAPASDGEQPCDSKPHASEREQQCGSNTYADRKELTGRGKDAQQ